MIRHILSHERVIVLFIDKESVMNNSNKSFNSVRGYSKLCKYWTLMMLSKMGGYKQIYSEYYCDNDELDADLGVISTDKNECYSRAIAKKSIGGFFSKIEKAPLAFPTYTILAKNVEWIGENIGLNTLEKQLLTFFVLERQVNHLRSATTSLGQLNTTRIYSVLGQLFGVSPVKMRDALDTNSRLSKSGLVKLDSTYLKLFYEKFTLSTGLSDKILVRHANPYSLFSKNFLVSKAPLLSPDNFPHLKQQIEHLDCYLSQSSDMKKQGVNILLYGTPGSGKSEFVKMFARHSKFKLYEIANGSQDGSPMNSGERLQSFTLTQSVLEKTARPLIIFDEVEDVFNQEDDADWGSSGKGNSSGQKAWMNELLENNAIPTFWVTNNINMIDPAHLRRFDYHMEMKAPPRDVRLKIIGEYTSELPVSGAWRNAIADHDEVSPAVIEKAKRFTSVILNQNPALSAETLMTHVISNSLQAMGLGEIKHTANHELLNYQLEVVNASCNLDELTSGLRQHPEARLCLYGPPGTGKTAFGHHLAKLLDKPLLVKRSSDIVSQYLGATERNMARMFNEAQETNAILLLDEADSFLRDRSGARHSWEVTAVNEMLTQMESFNGIFIASTNLMDQLDAASLRRFDLKIKFDYLKSEQSCSLMMDLAEKLSISLQRHELDDLRQLTNLTPGDFANVARQTKLTKVGDGTELLKRLSMESKTKVGNNTGRMGFIN